MRVFPQFLLYSGLRENRYFLIELAVNGVHDIVDLFHP